MRFLILNLSVIFFLTFVNAEDAEPTTTLNPSLSIENEILNDNIIVKDNDNVDSRNNIANKPFFTIADGLKSTTGKLGTTNKPKLSVYALINAKKDTKKVKAGQCNCFGEALTIMRYIKVLHVDLELGETGNLDCSNPTEASNRCERLCKEKASSRLGEDIDLKKPYKSDNEKIAIGQELCRQAGLVVLPTHLKIKSHIVCPGQKLATYRDTGLQSKQKFLCALGNFKAIK